MPGSLQGAVVPHAPLLLPGVSAEPDPAVVNIATAMTSLMIEADLFVVLSPHASRSGVYRQPSGDLAGFGLAGRAIQAETDSVLAQELAGEWGRPILDQPADHGVVVPLLLLAGERPVVACGIAEVTGPAAPAGYEQTLHDAASFAEALIKIAGDHRVVFIASAHTSASLTPRAPLTFRPEGAALDAQIARSLVSAPAGLCDIPAAGWSAGGACGAGPLHAFGCLFPSSRATVRAYEHPYGVGYLVATVNV